MRYYTEDHEWLDVVEDIATIGITAYAVEQLGDLVFVELPEAGARLADGDTVATVESVKAASDVYTPLSGEVLEINAAIVDDPALVRADPLGEGWFVRLRLADPDAVAQLLDEAAYRRLLG